MNEIPIEVVRYPQGPSGSSSRLIAKIPLESLKGGFLQKGDPAKQLKQVEDLYETIIKDLRSLLRKMDEQKAKSRRVSPKLMWKFGDLLHRYRASLLELGFVPSRLYDSLTRDLHIKRKWIEKTVILRNHLSDPQKIPQNLTWSKLEKSTRKKAKKLEQGIFIE